MVKIGLIGCGFMGAMHANCYKVLDGVKVVAVADIRKEKAQDIAKILGASVYSDGIDLINNADVDAIDICLPTYLHASYAQLAMRKVKNVFIEKPVALTVDECEKLLKVQEETGAGVQVGQVIRFWDEYVYLKQIIDSGVFGKVENAVFRRISPRPNWSWDKWIHDENKSGGALQDLHIHDIDFMLYAFGQPKNFYSAHTHDGYEKNSYVTTICDYGDFVVSVEGGWNFPENYPFDASFRVKFENAVIENNAFGFKLYTAQDCQDIVIEKKKLSAQGGGNISDLGGYYNELKYFTDCLLKGEKPKLAGLKEASDSVRFVREEMKK